MKSTESFKKVIGDHLKKIAESDEAFTEKLKKKKLDDCITYILNQVKQSDCNGFSDEEVFGMAIHFYDEENIKPGKKINANVVINQKIELSKEEIQKAKDDAKELVITEEKERLRKKPKKKKSESKVEPTLFD